MENPDNSVMRPQQVVTIFCNILPKVDDKQWIGYPQLQEFFDKGFYIEDFKQSVISDNRYMITFWFRKFSREPQH